MILISASWGCAGTAGRAEQTASVLIFGADADLKSVSRNDRVFEALEVGISEPLIAAGFDVLTEDELFSGRGAASGIRRTGDATLALIRSVDEPSARVAAVSTLYANARQMDNQMKIQLRLEIDLIEVASGAAFDDIKLHGPDNWVVTSHCTDACLQRALADRVRQLGHSAGLIAAEKTARYKQRVTRSETWVRESDAARLVELHFLGFAPAELFDLEDLLQEFDGFRDIRLTYSSAYRATYTYDSALSMPKLRQRLAKALEARSLAAEIDAGNERLDIHRIARIRVRNADDDAAW